MYHFVLSVAILMLIQKVVNNIVDLDKVEICGILYFILFYTLEYLYINPVKVAFHFGVKKSCFYKLL